MSNLFPPLILASSSPQRLSLLRQVGVEPIVLAPDADETLRDGESSQMFVERLARSKADSVVSQVEGDAVVLGADSIVDLDGEILGKPRDPEHALEMLDALVGRSHIVYTGTAVSYKNSLLSEVTATIVQLRKVSPEDLKAYIDCGESMGKAGACCVQGRGALFVERIEGSYHNVVGLPLHVVDQLCSQHGWPLATWMDFAEASNA